MPRVATLSAANKQTVRDSGKQPSRARWLKLRYVAVVLVCGWASYHYWHVQHPQMVQLSAEQSQLQSELQAKTQQKEALTKQAQQLQSNDYIAKYASEHYNLILPGQVMFNVTH